MADIALELDAAGTNADGTNPGTALLLTDAAAGWGLISFDAPSPEQDPLWASSVDTEGELLASSRDRNRTVTIGLEFTKSTDALAEAEFNKLGQKLGKLRREGGTLKLTTVAGTVGIFDVKAGGYGFPWDHALVLGKLGQVTLTLICQPYMRGTEVDLGDNVETSLPWLLFTDTGVKGDVPGLGRLVIDDDATAARRVVIAGLRSRYYSSASTAALAYQAESCALVDGTTAAGPGGSSGTVVQDTTLDQFGGFDRVVTIGANATAQTHIGTYRVLTRVYVPLANSGRVAVRMAYQPYVGATEIDNDWVWLTTTGLSTGTALGNGWIWADLGLAVLPAAAGGTQGWIGWLDATSTVLNDDINIDAFVLVPVDERYVESITTSDSKSIIPASGSFTWRHDGGYSIASSGYWSKQSPEGDYLRIPPAGQEARTLQVILLAEEGATSSLIASSFANAGRIWPSPSIPDVSAHLWYTPRYLVVPAA